MTEERSLDARVAKRALGPGLICGGAEGIVSDLRAYFRPGRLCRNASYRGETPRKIVARISGDDAAFNDANVG
jgi:hypothetical protein